MRSMKTLFAVALAAACGTTATGTAAETTTAAEQLGPASADTVPARLQEVTLRPSRLPTESRNLWGESVPSAEGQQLRQANVLSKAKKDDNCARPKDNGCTGLSFSPAQQK